MSEIFTESLYDSDIFRAWKPRTILIYLMIQAASEYKKPAVTLERIVEKTGWIRATIKRSLDDLTKLRKIVNNKGQYELCDGEFLLAKLVTPRTRHKQQLPVNTSKNKKVLQELVQKELKRKIAKPFKKELGVREKQKVSAMDVLKVFNDRYEAEYNEKQPWTEKRALAYCKRPLEWTGYDLEQVVKVIHFIFDEWDKIPEYFNLNNMRPNLSLIGSTVLWNLLREVAVEGFKENKQTVKDRYERDESVPSEGW